MPEIKSRNPREPGRNADNLFAEVHYGLDITTKIAVLVSGTGTNLQALLDAQARGELGGGKIELVISSRAGAYALERAKNAGVPAVILSAKEMAPGDMDQAMLRELERCGAGLVVTAGYLSLLGPLVLEAFRDRIVNVHPSLIPSFCGLGMYGLRVHKAALEKGVKVTGATVHLVDEVVDGGRILFQKAVDVLPDDTPESLQLRVMQQAEWILLPKAVAMLCGSTD